jgi:hypothetical protein
MALMFGSSITFYLLLILLPLDKIARMVCYIITNLQAKVMTLIMDTFVGIRKKC